MNLRHRYKITFEDETTLEHKLKVSWRPYAYILCLILFLAIAVCLAILVLAFTPLRNTLPGYLKESERAATEEQHLRLDSILQVYNINEAYLSNIFNALEPVVTDETLLQQHRQTMLLTPDSLLPASEEEKEFIEAIRERDKYNIANSAGNAPENLVITPPHPAAIVSEDSQESFTAEIILPHGAFVSAVAEGKIISVASSPRTAGGFEIIIQHPKGFLSKSGRLGKPMVRPGDHVSTGQIISATSSQSGRRGDFITLELWHNGDKLIPSRYIKTITGNQSGSVSPARNNINT